MHVGVYNMILFIMKSVVDRVLILYRVTIVYTNGNANLYYNYYTNIVILFRYCAKKKYT